MNIYFYTLPVLSDQIQQHSIRIKCDSPMFIDYLTKPALLLHADALIFLLSSFHCFSIGSELILTSSCRHLILSQCFKNTGSESEMA